MDWEGREESQNVEDRRGFGGKKAGLAVGGGLGILVTIVALILGIDPSKIGVGGGGGGDDGAVHQDKPSREFTPEEQRMAKFSKVVFRDTEIVWSEQFAKMRPRREYENPTLVLYDDEVPTACGEGSAAVGPFYCPGDSKVYIDLTFFIELDKKLGAPGEFARAYVIAHEVGHHVQRLLGYSKLVDQARGKANYNQMSVRLELQADFLAGVWAHYAQKEFKYLNSADIESATNAAFQIGDDRLLKKSGRPVIREKFTHGSSKQRVRWFTEGYKTGDVNKAAELFQLPYDQL